MIYSIRIVLVLLLFLGCRSAAQFVAESSKEVSVHPFMILMPVKPLPLKGQENVISIRYTPRQPVVGAFPAVVETRLRYRVEKVEDEIIEISVKKTVESEGSVDASRSWVYRYNTGTELLDLKYRPAGESSFQPASISALEGSKSCFKAGLVFECIALEPDYKVTRVVTRSPVRLGSKIGILEADVIRFEVSGPDLKSIDFVVSEKYPLQVFRAAVLVTDDKEFTSIEIKSLSAEK